MLYINLIAVIQFFIDLQKGPYLKIKVQCLFLSFFYFAVCGWPIHH